MEKQTLITVSREFGSGGHVVAAELAKRFGLPLYDESILDSIAHKHNLKLDKLSRFDESPINIFTSRRVRGFSNSPEENVAAMQASFLRQKADAGESFVVLGRCGEEYLRDYPGLISIFVLADRDFKQQRTMRIDKVSAEEALELMARNDKRRKYLHNQLCQAKWGDSRTYDICVNSAKLDIRGTCDVLEAYVRARIAAL